MNGVDPSGHAKAPNGATKGGGGNKTGGNGRLSQNNKTPASTSTRQSPMKPPYTAPPTPPKPAPNYQKPTYSSGAARAAQGVKTASAPSSPAADVMMQTVSDPYFALKEATGQWTLSPAAVTQSVEAAKAHVRRTCDPNANRISNQSNWDPKNLVMLSAGSSVLDPDTLSAFWEWFTAILAKKGATWATAGALATSDGLLPIGDAIALTLILSDFLIDAEGQITIEKKNNEDDEDNRNPSDIISKFFGEQSTPANPPPNGDKKPDNEEDYYHEGLVDVPDDWNMLEDQNEPVRSNSFKEFLREHGLKPKNWRKVMEKWASPDGTIYQRHYWTDGTNYFYHGEGIEVFVPH